MRRGIMYFDGLIAHVPSSFSGSPLAWDRRRESATLLQNRNAFGHAFIKDIAGNAGDKPLQPTFLDKGGRLRSLLFFTLQPHRPKTRHQKWPSETENRNDAPVARSGTWRLSLIQRMGPICADFGGPPANTGEDRTGCL